MLSQTRAVVTSSCCLLKRLPTSLKRQLISSVGQHPIQTGDHHSNGINGHSIVNGSKPFKSLNKATPYNICFLRHGQSTWNRDNRFIGWTDTPLTEDGVLEARVAGQILARSGMLFDEVHTSVLRRSIRTANLVLMEMGQEYIPVYKHYRLNERSYGALVGMNKKECVNQFGKDQVKRWRRSYDEPPPQMDPSHPFWPGNDTRYYHVRCFFAMICCYLNIFYFT